LRLNAAGETTGNAVPAPESPRRRQESLLASDRISGRTVFPSGYDIDAWNSWLSALSLFYLDATRWDVRPFCAELIGRGCLNTAKDALAPRRPAPPHCAALDCAPADSPRADRRSSTQRSGMACARWTPTARDPSSGAHADAATWRVFDYVGP
jgi:hypothetical protein